MNTMFEKCAVAGDITKAIDRRGCWSVAIVVIGGTESTAVKLQSCETADGSFTDYKTLIPASEASADQYKGFVLDLYGAGKFIKIVGATMATAVLGDCDHDVKQIAITAGEIPSGADLDDNKTATIDVSAYTEPVEITPTAGKDGMKKATVTLSNIPSGGNDDLQLYYWVEAEDSESGVLTTFSTAPAVEVALSPQQDMSFYSGGIGIANVYALTRNGTYAKISDTSFSITDRSGATTYVRGDSENDTTLSALVAGE